jgi:hypothetical protein
LTNSKIAETKALEPLKSWHCCISNFRTCYFPNEIWVVQGYGHCPIIGDRVVLSSESWGPAFTLNSLLHQIGQKASSSNHLFTEKKATWISSSWLDWRLFKTVTGQAGRKGWTNLDIFKDSIGVRVCNKSIRLYVDQWHADLWRALRRSQQLCCNRQWRQQKPDG